MSLYPMHFELFSFHLPKNVSCQKPYQERLCSSVRGKIVIPGIIKFIRMGNSERKKIVILYDPKYFLNENMDLLLFKT